MGTSMDFNDDEAISLIGNSAMARPAGIPVTVEIKMEANATTFWNTVELLYCDSWDYLQKLERVQTT